MLSTCKVGDDEVIVVSEGTDDSVDMSRYFSEIPVFVTTALTPEMVGYLSKYKNIVKILHKPYNLKDIETYVCEVLYENRSQ